MSAPTSGPSHGGSADPTEELRVVILTARDPLRTTDGPQAMAVAADLAADGHDVTLVLLEDAVVLARPGHAQRGLVDATIGKGVRVVAEDEALARHAIRTLPQGIEPASLGETVELLLNLSDRQVWL